MLPRDSAWAAAITSAGANVFRVFGITGQAQEVAKAFADAGVDYLFIGKGGAILLCFPGTTQDVQVFPAKDADNGLRLVTAVRQLGFMIDDTVELTCPHE